MALQANLKQIAVEAGLFSADEAESALAPLQTISHTFAGLRQKGLTEDQIAFLVACALQLPYVPLERMRIEADAARRIPLDLQVRYRVIPLRFDGEPGNELLYAAMLPERAAAIAIFLTNRLGIPVVPVIASEGSIRRHLDALLRKRERNDSTEEISVNEVDLDTPATLDAWRSQAH
jgi:hypothetical protein